MLVLLVVLAPALGVISVSAAPVEHDRYAVAQGTACTVVEPVTNETQNATKFYDYRNPDPNITGNPASNTYSSFGTREYQETSTSVLFFYEGSESASLVVVHDRLGDEDGGSTLTMTFDGLPADGEWVVEDDEYPGRDDEWEIGETTTSVDWKWGENRSDGGVYTGLGNHSGTVTITPEFNEEADAWGEWGYSGSDEYRIETWKLIGADGTERELDRDRQVFIHGGGCEETPPSAELTGPSSAEAGTSVTLDASGTSDDGTIGGYEWDFDGDGEIDAVTTGPTTDHVFNETGNYTVTATAFDTYGNGDTAELAVNVTQPTSPPNASLDAPAETTVNQSITFDASGSGDEGSITGYEWDFDGDGTVDAETTEPTVEHTYHETGEYTATVTVVDDDNETATDSATVTVLAQNQPPNASLDAPDAVGEGESVTLDASNSSDDRGIAEYRWDLDGDGEVDDATTDPVTEHTYDDPGTVTVAVTVVDSDGTTDSANATITVRDADDPPTAALDAPAGATVNESVTLDASGSADDSEIMEYRWDVDGDGTVDVTTTESTTEYTYTESGVFEASVTVVDSANQTDTATTSIEVRESDEPPTAALDAPRNATVDEPVTLDASSSSDDREIVEYRWDVDGDGEVDTTTTEPTFEQTYAESGEFQPSVTVVDSAGQTSTTTATITVAESTSSPPSAALSVPEGVTANESVTLDASGSTDDGAVVEYRWDVDGDGTVDVTTTEPTTDHSYTEAGEFEPSATVVDADDQTDTASATVEVGEATERLSAALDVPTEVMVNESVSLDASGSVGDDIESYRWDFENDGTIDTETAEPTVDYTFTDAGTQTVRVVVVGDDRTAGATVEVQVGNPDAAAAGIAVDGADATVGESVTFDAGGSTAASEITTYDWSFGDGSTASGGSVTHTYDSAGSYEVSVTITTAGGVTASATATVSVQADDDRDGDDGSDGNDAGSGNDGGDGNDGGSGNDGGDGNDGGGSDAGDGNAGGNDAGGNDGGDTDNDAGGGNNAGGNTGNSGDSGNNAGTGGNNDGSSERVDETETGEPDIGPANVTLSSQRLLVGETLVVEATVRNNGTASGTKTIEFEVDGEVVENREIPLAPGESRTVTFSHQFDTPGNRTIEVDRGEKRQIAVEPREPDIDVTSLTVDKEEVSTGEEFTVTAVLENDGDADGTREVTFELFGETVATETVSVPMGESAQVTLTREILSAGSYEIRVGNASVTVEVVDDSTATETPTPPNTGVTAPGFGWVTAVLALLVLTVVARRRHS